MSHILCVKTEHLPTLWRSCGLHPCTNSELEARIPGDKLWIGPRSLLETDESFVQLIPYAMIGLDDQVVVYRRSIAGGEGRLHGLSSIGFGGHIDLEDVVCSSPGHVSLLETLARACAREVKEELGAAVLAHQSTIGILRDTQTPVGRVHLGVLIQVELAAETQLEDLTTPDGAIEGLEICPRLSLPARRAEMEEWSKRAVDWLAQPLQPNET